MVVGGVGGSVVGAVRHVGGRVGGLVRVGCIGVGFIRDYRIVVCSFGGVSVIIRGRGGLGGGAWCVIVVGSIRGVIGRVGSIRVIGGVSGVVSGWSGVGDAEAGFEVPVVIYSTEVWTRCCISCER